MKTIKSNLNTDAKREGLKRLMISYEMPHGTTFEDLMSFIDQALQEAHEKGRLEALDDEFEEAETRGDIAKENYASGYNDCKKGRKKAPHDTRVGWCCACSYDLAVMEEKIQEAYKKGYMEGWKDEVFLKSELKKNKMTSLISPMETTFTITQSQLDAKIEEAKEDERKAVLKIVKKVFYETVITDEGYDYDFPERLLGQLKNKK